MSELPAEVGFSPFISIDPDDEPPFISLFIEPDESFIFIPSVCEPLVALFSVPVA
ncbi:hypothetical protein [Chenggangzhangella methanolivorans]|uniref:Uncharacterized protein n=1 Tax=Chenggangzhangella methanolivorans TaxID=1437009 RepID=A0A9E6RCV1_9HYPH|nr:hypothetical protein [Chenggangzhangella methanolivorans]QZO01990.1 hypothetical protein K6K41_12225 [Chenggangzhangella methanolivorans]